MMRQNPSRFGIPTSFVYCTIYQQNIWREVDEKLILEQRRVWRDFFSMIDSNYNALAPYLKMPKKQLSLASKFENMNFKDCWNAHVMKYFAAASKGVDLSGLAKSLVSTES